MVEGGGRFAGEPEQFGPQVGARRRAPVGVAGEQAVDEVDEPARERRTQSGEVRRVALQPGEGRVGVGLADERHAAGEALVEDEPERVQVGSSVEAPTATCSGDRYFAVPIITLSLVRSSPPSRPLAMPKSVSSTRPSGVTRMLPGFTSRCTKPARWAASSAAGDARADVDRQLRAQPGLDVEQLAQALAVDELHHDGLAAALGEHVVDGDDVRMGEASDGDRLAAEALGDDRVGRQARLEPLEGDAPVERQVGGEPDLGHPSLSQSALQAVAAGENDRSIALFGRRAWSGGSGRSRHSATSN